MFSRPLLSTITFYTNDPLVELMKFWVLAGSLELKTHIFMGFSYVNKCDLKSVCEGLSFLFQEFFQSNFDGFFIFNGKKDIYESCSYVTGSIKSSVFLTKEMTSFTLT